MSKGKIPVKKRSCLKNTWLFLSSIGQTPNIFKSKVFPLKNLDKTSTSESTSELAPELTHKQAPDPKLFDMLKTTKAKHKYKKSALTFC